MASRSLRVSARGEHRRTGGGSPPVRADFISHDMRDPAQRAANGIQGFPRRQRRHSSVFSASVKRGPRRQVHVASMNAPPSAQSARRPVLVPVAVDSPRRYTGAMNAIDERACGKPGCDNFGKPGLNIVGHGWFVTKSGRRRRYRCTVCGGTLSTNTGTAYRGLRCSRREFDQVASLRVEGVSISATARVTGHSRTTIARWLERAATAVHNGGTENLIRTVRVTDRADVGPANDGNVSIAAVHSVNVDEWLASFGRSSGRRAACTVFRRRPSMAVVRPRDDGSCGAGRPRAASP